MIGAFSSATQGLTDGYDRFNRAADRISRDTELTDLAGNVVQMQQAKNEIRANVAVIKAEDELVGSILDVFA
ncbi:MAG: hypothetical protein U0P30_15760 [Vicinamibacterales bacterium]